MTEIKLDMASTIAIAAALLVLGNFMLKRIKVLDRFFIPAPVIGGLIFSIITLIGYQTGTFKVIFYDDMKNYLLLVFFTTIGFSASFELLKKGGTAVFLFLACAVGLVFIQNIVGVSLAKVTGVHPYIGLAAGSVSMTGGHGTSAAFGPLLEQAGAVGALPAAIAASTWGLVFGCLIGGPLGISLMQRFNITSKDVSDFQPAELNTDGSTYRPTENAVMKSVLVLAIAVGLGVWLLKYVNPVLKQSFNFQLPAYLGSMFVAAFVRNYADWKKWHLPIKQLEHTGSVSLAFFLTMALMSMKLWELYAVAGPLLIILIAQTFVMFIFAYFITFRVMGKDYDSVVMSAGHCGFGMGATPNAMANMQAFAAKNGPSVKAFFVVPLVGSLFIDFFNAPIIALFMNYFKI